MSNNLKSLLEQTGVNLKQLKETYEKTFTPEELAELTGLLSLYEPLLQRSFVLNKIIVSLLAQEEIKLDDIYTQELVSWIEDYEGLNEAVLRVGKGDTVH